MTEQEKILKKHLNKGRTDADRKRTSDTQYYKRWKACYPDTLKHIIAAMNEYAKTKPVNQDEKA